MKKKELLIGLFACSTLFILSACKTTKHESNVNTSQTEKVNDGEFVDYYESGKVWLKGSYKNNLQDGMFIEYYEDGAVRIEEKYLNGERSGQYISYFKNGQIESKGMFKNGLEEGACL